MHIPLACAGIGAVFLASTISSDRAVQIFVFVIFFPLILVFYYLLLFLGLNVFILLGNVKTKCELWIFNKVAIRCRKYALQNPTANLVTNGLCTTSHLCPRCSTIISKSSLLSGSRSLLVNAKERHELGLDLYGFSKSVWNSCHLCSILRASIDKEKVDQIQTPTRNPPDLSTEYQPLLCRERSLSVSIFQSCAGPEWKIMLQVMLGSEAIGSVLEVQERGK